MKVFIILALVMLTSCVSVKKHNPHVVDRSALINSHDYKYAYLIGRRVYKSNKQYCVGDTLPVIPTEFLRIH